MKTIKEILKWLLCFVLVVVCISLVCIIVVISGALVIKYDVAMISILFGCIPAFWFLMLLYYLTKILHNKLF